MTPSQGSAGSVLPEWFGQFYGNVTMTGERSSCLKQRTLWKNQHGSRPSRVGMSSKGEVIEGEGMLSGGRDGGKKQRLQSAICVQRTGIQLNGA